MKIVIVNNAKDVGERAASLVAQATKERPNLILGLATGKTMIPFYRGLIKLYRKKKVSFAEVKSFNLDEYIGLKSRDKGSLRYFMEKNFFSKVDFKKENVHFLDGRAKNKKRECENYERQIKKSRIGLQILGIGRNGHIGFNEPGSSFKSKTREVFLSESTRRKKIPRKALTMGISNIMNTKEIFLLASGREKAEIIHRVLHGMISEDVPASVLQKHRNVVFILDKKAARQLEEG